MATAKLFRNYAAFIIEGMTEELQIKDLNFEFLLSSVVCRPSSIVTASQVPDRISSCIKNIPFYIHPKSNKEIDNNRRTDCSK